MNRHAFYVVEDDFAANFAGTAVDVHTCNGPEANPG